ncbi:DNA-binding protein [Rhizobium ruizarguesonis]|uniref:DNA-binding protein n=1 Tax=Rhizobium ruizarguesonis TaxID=2081791 RepID=UPI0010312005|nr:DNA-binding protein [Rhizobium ruizarguesonis]TBB03881.1 DNA-binding protein [Rhizobium ruizarguesonis]
MEASTNTAYLLPAKKVWQRYSISSRTIDRWLFQPALAFPRPIIINRRRYWNEHDLILWERSRPKEA